MCGFASAFCFVSAVCFSEYLLRQRFFILGVNSPGYVVSIYSWISCVLALCKPAWQPCICDEHSVYVIRFLKAQQQEAPTFKRRGRCNHSGMKYCERQHARATVFHRHASRTTCPIVTVVVLYLSLLFINFARLIDVSDTKIFKRFRPLQEIAVLISRSNLFGHHTHTFLVSGKS